MVRRGSGVRVPASASPPQQKQVGNFGPAKRPRSRPAGRSSDPARFESPRRPSYARFCALNALFDALEQLARRGQVEAASQDRDRLQARRALAALQQADLGAMQVADLRQRLLREPHPLAVMAKVDGELLAYVLHVVHVPNFRDAQTEGLQTTRRQMFVYSTATLSSRWI